MTWATLCTAFMTWIGGWFTTLCAGLIALWAGEQNQQQKNQIDKDAANIQAIYDMRDIERKNAALSDSDVLKQLREESSARASKS